MAKESTQQKAPTNPNLPLFYSNPVPLDQRRNPPLLFNKSIGYGFTEGVNAVPLNMVEFSQAAGSMPIAFSPDATATPVAVLGLRDGENLYLDNKKQWLNDAYIPAYVRRYPFIFAAVPNSDQYGLCLDETDQTIAKKDGERIFDDAGEPTELAKNAMEFCKSYHAAALGTQALSKALVDLDLLVERQVDIKVKDKQIRFAGFRIVDEKKLNELPDDKFMDLKKRGFLPFIYAHLISNVQWNRLTQLLMKQM
ncbi:MAG: sapC family protein [Alphaproteobacteria bacterium]|nr:sapC family protein [Alphaproteobacteria bacterium]